MRCSTVATRTPSHESEVPNSVPSTWSRSAGMSGAPSTSVRRKRIPVPGPEGRTVRWAFSPEWTPGPLKVNSFATVR